MQTPEEIVSTIVQSYINWYSEDRSIDYDGLERYIAAVLDARAAQVKEQCCAAICAYCRTGKTPQSGYHWIQEGTGSPVSVRICQALAIRELPD